MPIFVGSNSDDSRIRSNRVGFAVSTANPGSASEGDVYFNSSDSGLRAYDGSAWSAVGAGGGTFSGITSGTLANGQTVIIHSDGKVGIVTISGSADPSVGTPVVFESSDSTYNTSAIFDSSSNKVVIAYRDGANSNYGTAIVGTVSGTSISFGTPVVFNSATTTYISATFDSSSNKVVIAYSDYGNSQAGTAIVGTVSGTSISFGTPGVFDSAGIYYASATYDSTNNKVVIAYRDGGNSNYGTGIVGTVSGTSISFGSAVVFNSDRTDRITTTFDSTNGKVVVAYADHGNSNYGKARIATVSGTSISFEGSAVFESANTNSSMSATYDSSNDRVVIAYRDGGNSFYGTAVVGTISGTSISFGTPVVFESAETGHFAATYDSTKEKVVIAYRDYGNSNYGTVIVGTVSGTSISFGSAVVFESGGTYDTSATYDSANGKVVISYQDEGNSNYGTAVVFSVDTLETNLTSENFLGFSDADYSDGDTAKIQIAGAVDDAQSGLTTGSLHYVQPDGTLSTTAGDPSVEAGTALSATKIKVKK